MNVLITADYATPASGNFVASCFELGRALKQRGDSLTFVFPENKNTLSKSSWVHWLESEGFCVYLLKKDSSQEYTLDFLDEIISKHQIDIFHNHFGLFNQAILTHFQKKGVKILVHDHMDFAAGCNLLKEKLYCVIRSLFYRMNKISIASVNPQKDNAYFLAQHYYIPNGLSLIRNTAHSETREEVRNALEIEQDKKVCLFLGWDVYRKGLDIAVNAVNEIRKHDSSVMLAVVGMGDPPAESRLDFVKSSTGIDPNSSWIKYLPSREDMFAYHRSADVYLSASRSEAFSYGILEAISQNTPVAVSDIKGTSWCHRYTKAVVYSTEDYKSCADAIRRALELGKSESNADELVEDHSIEKWYTQMIEIYEKL